MPSPYRIYLINVGLVDASDASPVQFEGFEAMDWFVAKSGEEWRVYEKTTGQLVPGSEASSKQSSIVRAKARLQLYGVEEVSRGIEKARAEMIAAGVLS